MSTDILDQIDHTLEDWSTSPDAVRWTPAPVEPERPLLTQARAARMVCTPVQIHIDFQPFVDQYVAAIRRAMSAIADAINNIDPAVFKLLKQMGKVDQQAQLQRRAMHHNYVLRQKARRRRNRKRGGR